MTEHTCTVLTPGCYRCDLNRDEIAASAVLGSAIRPVRRHDPPRHHHREGEQGMSETIHRMLPGSHERPGGAECRCGASWSRGDGRCVAEENSEKAEMCRMRHDGTRWVPTYGG